MKCRPKKMEEAMVGSKEETMMWGKEDECVHEFVDLSI
jgi:hypothetical protein